MSEKDVRVDYLTRVLAAKSWQDRLDLTEELLAVPQGELLANTNTVTELQRIVVETSSEEPRSIAEFHLIESFRQNVQELRDRIQNGGAVVVPQNQSAGGFDAQKTTKNEGDFQSSLREIQNYMSRAQALGVEIRTNPTYTRLVGLDFTIDPAERDRLGELARELAATISDLSQQHELLTVSLTKISATSQSQAIELSRIEGQVKKAVQTISDDKLSELKDEVLLLVDCSVFLSSYPNLLQLLEKITDSNFQKWLLMPAGARSVSLYTESLEDFERISREIGVFSGRLSAQDTTITKVVSILKEFQQRLLDDLYQFWKNGLFESPACPHPEFDTNNQNSYIVSLRKAQSMDLTKRFGKQHLEALEKQLSDDLKRAKESFSQVLSTLHDPRFGTLLESMFWDQSDYLLEVIRKKLAMINKDEARVQSKKEIQLAISDELEKIAARPNYIVNVNEDEIDEEYKRVVKLLKQLENFGDTSGDFLKTKEQIVVTFYKLYRKVLFKELEQSEFSNVGWKSVQYVAVFERKILQSMENLVAELTGVSLFSIQEIEDAMKLSGGGDDDGRSAGTTTQDSIISSALNAAKSLQNPSWEKLIQDSIDVRVEYVARKFAHITWSENQNIILGKSSRKYPEGAIADTYPIMLVSHQVINGGLRSPEFGTTTNAIVNPTKKDKVLSSSEPNKRETISYAETVFGEAWRVLDRWALGQVYFKQSNGDPLTTAQAHIDDSEIAEALQSYLVKRSKKRAELMRARGEVSTLDASIYKKNDILRAFRAWALITVHQSSRAIKSAEGPDYIYYAHKFHEYTPLYVKAGTASWPPEPVAMMFTTVHWDEEKKRYVKFNPLPILMGDDPEVKKVASILDRISPVLQGFEAFERKLASMGVIQYSKGKKVALKGAAERKARDGFESYDFLLSPLLTMRNYSQKRVRIDNENFERVLAPESKDVGEYYSQTPILGTVFLKNNDGTVQYYPDQEDQYGNKYSGDPISFLSYRNELDEIVYEALPFKENGARLLSMIGSLGTNGYRFLTTYLKTPDLVSKLKDGSAVAVLKNEAKYVMRHFPSLGVRVAAGEDYGRVLMNMVIAQLVFSVALIRTNPVLKDHWNAQQLRQFVNELVSSNNVISQETADVIFEGIYASRAFSLTTSAFANSIQKNLEQKFKVT